MRKIIAMLALCAAFSTQAQNHAIDWSSFDHMIDGLPEAKYWPYPALVFAIPCRNSKKYRYPAFTRDEAVVLKELTLGRVSRADWIKRSDIGDADIANELYDNCNGLRDNPPQKKGQIAA